MQGSGFEAAGATPSPVLVRGQNCVVDYFTSSSIVCTVDLSTPTDSSVVVVMSTENTSQESVSWDILRRLPYMGSTPVLPQIVSVKCGDTSCVTTGTQAQSMTLKVRHSVITRDNTCNKVPPLVYGILRSRTYKV